MMSKMKKVDSVLVEEARMINPCATLETIGLEFDISKERVRQILKKANLQTRAYHPPSPMFECMHCGKPTTNRKFCNHECCFNYTHIPLKCPVCEKIFYREQSWVTYWFNHPQPSNGKLKEHIYCSRKCHGKVVGRKYGFAAHTENCGRKLPSKITKPVAFRIEYDVYSIVEKRASKKGIKVSEYLRYQITYDAGRKR